MCRECVKKVHCVDNVYLHAQPGQKSLFKSPFCNSFLQFQFQIHCFLAFSEAGNVPCADSMRNAHEEVDKAVDWLEECAHCDCSLMMMMIGMEWFEGGENFRLGMAAVGAATTM